jgi:hypothetical protein
MKVEYISIPFLIIIEKKLFNIIHSFYIFFLKTYRIVNNRVLTGWQYAYLFIRIGK